MRGSPFLAAHARISGVGDPLAPKTDGSAPLNEERAQRRACERALARLQDKQQTMLEAREALRGKVATLGEERRRAAREVPWSRPLRARLRALHALPLAPARAREADQRETEFLRTSEAYAMAVAAPWPPADVQPVEIDGLTFWVPLDDRLPERAERAARQDLAYRAIVQARELTVGGIMIDVGANLGRTSVPRIILGDVEAVYGFEADADNYRCLVQTARSNGLAGRLLPDFAAVAADDGVASLRKSRFVGGHRLVRGGVERSDVVNVPARRLDSLVAAHGIDANAIRYVKVDVQGWEVGVLRGASELLRKSHIVWQLEVDLHLLGAAGFSPAELFGPIEASFSHFVDVNPEAPGRRHRAIGELREALAYLPSDGSLKTDVLVYSV